MWSPSDLDAFTTVEAGIARLRDGPETAFDWLLDRVADTCIATATSAAVGQLAVAAESFRRITSNRWFVDALAESERCSYRPWLVVSGRLAAGRQALAREETVAHRISSMVSPQRLPLAAGIAWQPSH